MAGDEAKHAPCVISVAEHAGWANLVCIAAPGHVPAVIARRQVTLIDPGLPTQPYHHDSKTMTEADANALIARVRGSIATRTLAALRDVVSDLARRYTVVALAIRESPFPALPETVATAWSAYPLLCSADGMLYQLAICQAARELGLDVHQCRRGDETSSAATQLGATPDEIDEFIVRIGRPSGPPWTQELRRAYALGIAVLAAHQRLRIPASDGNVRPG